jgi:polyhydroxybutyrate depolymerase
MVKRTALAVLLSVALAAYIGAAATSQLPAAAPEPSLAAAEPASEVAPDGMTESCADAGECQQPQAGVAHGRVVKPVPPSPTTPKPPPPSSSRPPVPPPPGGGTPGCGQPVKPGATKHTIVANGEPRTYLKIVPNGLDPKTPVPVIMGLHGGNGAAEQANAYMGLTGSAAALYIYPQAGPFLDARAGWNVDPAGKDLPYFDALVADLKAHNCVQASRIFVAGMSNGGFMVNSLLCHRPNLFRAAASVAGGGPQNNCTTPRAFLGVHGTADPTVPIGTGRYSRSYWLAANKHGGGAPAPANPSPCVSHPGTLNPVIWCEHSGAHDWPSWAGSTIRNWFLSLR